MKLTSQEEYGLRCILSLAREEARGSEPRPSLTLGQIAEREGLSTEYAGKLMGILGRGALVESERGRHGGFRLARSAREICVSEVLAVLGDKLYRPTETCDRFAGDFRFCVHTTTCSIRSLWSGLQLLLDTVLSRTTLYDLVSTSEGHMSEWIRNQLEAMSRGGLAQSPPFAAPGTIPLLTPALRAKSQVGSPSRTC
jgi:Rrf2 family transcriptional regulator, iron-sulfur cluster assembly transcription factor